MKKIFQNRVVAWAVLILAVALACFWGISRKEHFESKKTTELLEVKQYQWINDSAKLLSSQTEKTVEEYNTGMKSPELKKFIAEHFTQIGRGRHCKYAPHGSASKDAAS